MTMRACVLAALLLVTACGGSSSSATTSENALQRLRWQELQIDRYRVEQRVVCFCPTEQPSVIVTVSEGEIAAIENSATGTPLDPSEFALYYTVDGLFDLVVEATEAKADSLEVVYDPVFFFPSTIDIDFVEEAVDDELLVETGELVPLRD